jgi:hypothetical protein
MAIAVRDRIPCPDCGRHDIMTVHWCGPDNGLTRAREKTPVCCYCWGPVAPRLSKRGGRLLGWPDFCSEACRKLGGRPFGAKPGPAARALIAAVAGATVEELAS